MKGIKVTKMMFENDDTIPFTCWFFLQYFSSDLHHLSDSIFYMKLLQSSSIFKQKTIMKCLAIKIFA